MIKILIVDDSATETMLLKHVFEKEKDMQVIGCAKNGKEAIELASKLKPDIITMDINMPLLDGFEATRFIMNTNPVPIVVITSTMNDTQMNTAFLALEAGALSVLNKPVNVCDPEFNVVCKRITTLIRSMSEIKVIKKRFKNEVEFQEKLNIQPLKKNFRHYEIVAIGSSVGGPKALRTILSQLPAHFPVPIVIVQHMSQGFIEGLSKWLNQYCSLMVKCATDQEVLNAGTVYFAPDQHHLKIERLGSHLIARLHQGDPVSGFYPSITTLLNSVAKTCDNKAVAMLLTGMGHDGASGLFEIKAKKGHTIIQDPDSCVVFGMAGVAQSLGAVDHVLKLDEIAGYLIELIE